MDAINPREIIAMSIRNGGRANSYNKALYAISDLEANGYQIIHRDENHGPTLERAAAMAENLGGTWSGSRDVSVCVQEAAVDDKCEDIAASLRAMEVKHHG